MMLPPHQKSIFKMWLANETLTLSILQVNSLMRPNQVVRGSALKKIESK